MPHAFKAHPKHPAVDYLIRLHADLGGRIQENKREAEKLAADMKHVEAVLKMFDPEFNARAISARRRVQGNPWFKRGTLFRRALDVLRGATAPIAVREIADAILTANGVTDHATEVALADDTPASLSEEQVLDDQYWHFLGVIPGASPAEISAARNRLARMLHPDRGGTVEDMQRLNEAFEIVTGKRKAPSSSIFGKGSSSSSSSLDDLARILHLELTIKGLQNQLENERKDHDRRMEMWFNLGCKDSDRLRKFEGLARSLAIVMLDAKQLNSKSFLKEVAEFVAEFESMNVDKIIEMERRLIDGPVKEAITKANSTDGSQAEIDRMKAAQQREQRRSNLPEVQCVAPGCANTFRPRRRNHKTCSDACRKSLSRTQPSIQ